MTGYGVRRSLEGDMPPLTTSQPGLDALIHEEGSIDGLYDDVKGYGTFGVGHLVHPADKGHSLLLAAAKSSDAWKAKLHKSHHVTFLPRSAQAWPDFAQLRAKAIEVGEEAMAKKRHGKAFATLSEHEKAAIRGKVAEAVRHEATLLTKTPAQELRTDIARYEQAVCAAITKCALTQDEFDALVSLAFNIGIANFTSSTLVKRINEGTFRTGDLSARQAAIADIEAAFLAWKKSGGLVLKPLVARRQRESDRFLRGARQQCETLRYSLSNMRSSGALRRPSTPGILP
jgi:GH24 family phage-related lysozyme (muramidase)